MKKFTALILAAGLLLGTLCIGASAAGYGRNPSHNIITAQGDCIYYYEDNAIWAKNLVTGKNRTVCKVENPEYVKDICVMGNSLYYVTCFTSRYYGDPIVHKVDIGSGKKTEFYKGSSDGYIEGIITAGNRVYIQFDEEIHEEVPEEYFVQAYGTDGKYLKTFSPAPNRYASSMFIDTDSYEACIAAPEVKEVLTCYGEGEDEEVDYSLQYTDAYNIVKIKPDLTEEEIVIPAKIGNKINNFVYCDEKYVYYIDNKQRLCRYNSETEKKRVLADSVGTAKYRDRDVPFLVGAAKYKDGAVYFLTEKGDLKKYENGSISTVRECPGFEFDLCFFDDYIIYFYDSMYAYDVIGYDGKELA